MLYPQIFEECNAPAPFELKRDDHVSDTAIEHWHKWTGDATIADATSGQTVKFTHANCGLYSKSVATLASTSSISGAGKVSTLRA